MPSDDKRGRVKLIANPGAAERREATAKLEQVIAPEPGEGAEKPQAKTMGEIPAPVSTPVEA